MTDVCEDCDGNCQVCKRPMYACEQCDAEYVTPMAAAYCCKETDRGRE